MTLQNHVNAAYKSRRKISIAVAGLSFVLFSATAQAQVTLAAVVELAQRNSAPVRLAQADVQKAAALLSQSRSAFIPSVTFGSGLPAFSEIGFTGSLPTIWDSTVQSMVFSLPQIQAIRAAHTGRCITRDEKARVFRSAAGVLNTMHLAEVAGVNARLFEATGCGAAVLTDFRPTIPDLFAVGDEVLVFHDFDNLVDQATRLLGETGLTSRLGDAAARRAHRDHTYDLRVTEILEKIA